MRSVIAGALVLLVLQLLPFGRIDNPPVTQDAPWPDGESRRLAVAACYDCHSNETDVKWFDRIAPASWLVKQHVDEGRSTLNFSEWDQPQGRGHEWHDAVEEGSMPMPSYTLLHPAGRLSSAERDKLVAALRQLEGNRGRGGREDGDG